MANDQSWQRRSDEWVKASHESRKRKEAGMTRSGKVGADKTVGNPTRATPDSENR
ncbi:hypothetical protein [Marinimicrobium sp. ARAG 43.8]|uniref:hypothetical protein n=1 Tax=Marinimicrobium sp. ARAG 43.8 TaxID=3418719 RepID=UPI003CE755D7